MAQFGSAVNSAHFDANQIPSITGVIGTLGTSDISGTASTLPIGVQPSTGAVYVWIAGTDVNTGGGAAAGTNVNVVTGTINVGTTVIPTGTITTIAAGTQNTLGTVGNLNNGSVILQSGTLTTGTLQNLVTGTINALAAGTITGGTLQNLNNGTLALVTSVTTISNLTNGSIILQSGTLTTGTLQNLVSGTINALAAGTITTGTIAVTAGTLSPIPTIGQSTFGTIGTTGVSVFGTLAGGTSSGAGTEIFVTNISISLPANGGSQDVSVGFGTNGGTFHAGTGRLVRGMFLVGGGIQKSFDPPINSGTNAQLCYFQAGAGTAHIDVTYFITPSTL